MKGLHQPSTQSLDKALQLLVRVADDEGRTSMSALAQEANLPVSTTHRLLRSLERVGLIAAVRPGRFVKGPTLLRLGRADDHVNQLLIRISKPILSALSRRTGRICHLGVLDDTMMTYLVKEGDADNRTVSRCGMQLEAYCTGIGKALLAHLNSKDRAAYLESGVFVALTSTTLTSAESLTLEFNRIADRGYAIDDGEMFPGQICIAVPIRCGDQAVAAISLVVTQTGEQHRATAYLGRLQTAARQIETRLLPFSDLLAPLD